MASVNKVILVGRVGKDMELKETASGMLIGNFSLATSESFKSGDKWEEKTEWHNILLFNKQAEYASGKAIKGNLIYIEGKIQISSWEGEDGKKRYKTEIVCNNLKNLTPKEKKEGGGASYQSSKKDNFVVGNSGDTKEDLPF